MYSNGVIRVSLYGSNQLRWFNQRQLAFDALAHNQAPPVVDNPGDGGGYQPEPQPEPEPQPQPRPSYGWSHRVNGPWSCSIAPPIEGGPFQSFGETREQAVLEARAYCEYHAEYYGLDRGLCSRGGATCRRLQ